MAGDLVSHLQSQPKGNPFRQMADYLNANKSDLGAGAVAEAISKATDKFSNSTMGTASPVQVGNILVIPSRAPFPNAPVMGIRENGTVVMGRAPEMIGPKVEKMPDGGAVITPTEFPKGIQWETSGKSK